MRNHRMEWAITVLACLGLGCWLLPVFGQSRPGRQVVSSVPPRIILGVTPPKTPNVEIISARDPRFALLRTRDATGDSYRAAGFAQDTVNAWFLDSLPDDHTFGTGEESAGTHEISGVDIRIAGADNGPGAPDTNFLQVNYLTADGTDLVPEGSISPNNESYNSWRFDVGTVENITDKIEWTPNPGFTVVGSGFCLYQGETFMGCFDLFEDQSDANGVAGVGILGLEGGADIAGSGITEMIMYWEIQVESSCGDGNVDAGEQCDDGNNVGCDGCSPTCVIELAGDFDHDGDVDLRDYWEFLQTFNGPVAP